METIISGRSLLDKTQIPADGLASRSSTNFLRALKTLEIPYEGYNPFAVEKNDLRTFPSYPFGQHLEVSGKVFDADGKVPLADCVMEIWHLSPNSTKYTHKAKLRTNEFGEYYFITDQPKRELGKNYKIYFKVTKGSDSYFSELSFNNTQAFISGKHSEKNKELGNDLLAPKKRNFINKTALVFNLKLS